jgi:hypothetical protein
MDMTQFRPGLPAARVDRELRSALAVLEAAQQAALLWFHEVLARKLYLELGYASMELYAAEALGFSPNRTSQFLKLARDLDRLPPLKEAVAQGRLEWTKAQQVGRIASPRTAEKWVEAAEKSSRRELAQKVKAARLAQERRRSGQQELGLAVEAAPLPAPRVAVKLSFDSLDAAQLEAMIEAAKKAGLVPADGDQGRGDPGGDGSVAGGGRFAPAQRRNPLQSRALPMRGLSIDRGRDRLWPAPGRPCGRGGGGRERRGPRSRPEPQCDPPCPTPEGPGPRRAPLPGAGVRVNTLPRDPPPTTRRPGRHQQDREPDHPLQPLPPVRAHAPAPAPGNRHGGARPARSLTGPTALRGRL